MDEQLFGIVSKEAEEAASVSETAKSDAKIAHGEADAAKDKADAASKSAGEAQQKAGDALVVSKTARDEADVVSKDAKQLRSDLTQVGADAKAAEAELATEQRKTAEVQKAAADAQRALNEFLVAHTLSRQAKPFLSESLKALPPAKLEIWYRAEDGEVRMFVASIKAAVEEAQWTVEDPIPIPPSRFNGKDLPFGGLEIVSNHVAGFFPGMPDWKGTPNDVDVLSAMLAANSGKKVDRRLVLLAIAIGIGPDSFVADSSLKEGEFRVIIGPRIVRP